MYPGLRGEAAVRVSTPHIFFLLLLILSFALAQLTGHIGRIRGNEQMRARNAAGGRIGEVVERSHEKGSRPYQSLAGQSES